jgi:hypothetical protein
VGCVARVADELGERQELGGVSKEAAVLNRDVIQQVRKCGRVGVDHVDIRVNRDTGKVRTLVKEPLEPRPAARLGFESGSRAKKDSRLFERGHVGLD